MYLPEFDSHYTTSASMQLVIQQSNLVPILDGFTNWDSSNDAIRFDGSKSYDPDEANRTLEFLWECFYQDD